MENDKEEEPLPYDLRPNELQKEMNKTMAELIPELDSEYARTPMARSRWKEPSETNDDSTPCFIPADYEEGKRKDYIWMPKKKDLKAGYYHLATQEAYSDQFAASPKKTLLSVLPPQETVKQRYVPKAQESHVQLDHHGRAKRCPCPTDAVARHPVGGQRGVGLWKSCVPAYTDIRIFVGSRDVM